MTGKVAIIILNWNGWKDTLECLKSVQAIDYPDTEIVVVDNGSTDQSVEIIRENFPRIALIENKRNLGFAEGNNVGMRYALERGAEFIFLLNNDAVVASEAIVAFRDAADKFGAAGVFAGKIYYWSDPKRIWYAGGSWISQMGSFEHVGLDSLDESGQYASPRETDHACGCAMFVRASVIREIGFLEPRFFLTFEEADWCFRARKHGYGCVFVPDAKIWHKVSASFGGQSSALFRYFYTRNRLLWAERHLSLVDQTRVWRRTIIDLLPQWDRRAYSNGSLKNTYWKLLSWQRALRRGWTEASQWAMRRAIADYIFRRFGDCPPTVRERSRRAPLTQKVN